MPLFCFKSTGASCCILTLYKNQHLIVKKLSKIFAGTQKNSIFAKKIMLSISFDGLKRTKKIVVS
jgi:hypothetical protein